LFIVACKLGHRSASDGFGVELLGRFEIGQRTGDPQKSLDLSHLNSKLGKTSFGRFDQRQGHDDLAARR
jgi:hypothetical protein